MMIRAASPASPVEDGPPHQGHVLRQVILKIAQRCNLNCTYCYVYNRGDDSWASRPPIISDAVVDALSRSISRHCSAHALTSFTVELHGGEPLLVGHARMRRILTALRDTDGVNVCFSIQTNGVLLDAAWIALFDEFNVSIGLSLDGPPKVADRRRLMRLDGAGSTVRVVQRIDRLRRQAPSAFARVFSGCLCVIDPHADAAELIRWFVDHGFDSFDLLLPNGNRANLPEHWSGVEPYTRFLLDAFDYWYAMGKEAPRIRKFELMLTGLLGGKVLLDSLGGDLRLLCVVESDGTIGMSDVTRLCGGMFAEDALNVFSNALSEHASYYKITELQTVASRCEKCTNLYACGGGYLPHRFDGTGFDNPSLYCEALFALSERMRTMIHRDFPPAVLAKAQRGTASVEVA